MQLCVHLWRRVAAHHTAEDGRYEVMPTYRKGPPGGASVAREAAPLPARDTIHAAVAHDYSPQQFGLSAVDRIFVGQK